MPSKPGLMEYVSRHPWLRLAWRAIPSPLRVGPLRWVRDRVLVLLGNRVRARIAFPRTAAWLEWSPPRPESIVVKRPLHGVADGVNVLGYIHGQFGLAEAARMYARALIENGTPVALADIDLALPHGWDDKSLSSYLDATLPYPVCIIFVNPDYLGRAIETIGAARLEGRHIIACWFWELESIPDSWLPALEMVDEVLVATSFVEAAVRKVTGKRVTKVALPLSDVLDSGLQRVDFGLSDDAFLFLYSFDFNSYLERKNPLAVIAAFRSAFPPERRDVQLLLKTSNGYRHLPWLNAVLDAVGGDDRILLRDEVLDRAHMRALQRCCDAYVSLHRAEGFGLGLAECMADGKPVIATGWSGNMEFMDEECAALVGFRLVELTDADYPGGKTQRWAEPDIAHAAQWMRTFADDRALAAAFGERGRVRVRESLSARGAAESIAARLREIHNAAQSAETYTDRSSSRLDIQ